MCIVIRPFFQVRVDPFMELGIFVSGKECRDPFDCINLINIDR